MRWIVAALLLALVAWPVVAFAHAEPARVRPGDGAVLTSAPLSLEIEMSQELAREAGANDIDVFDAAGREVTTVAAVIDNGNRRRLTVALPSALPAGTYTVRWKSLSAEDGDPAEGLLAFAIDPAATPTAGKELLRDDAPPVPPPATTQPATVLDIGGGDDSTWIFALAAGISGLLVGAGVTFLLVRRSP